MFVWLFAYESVYSHNSKTALSNFTNLCACCLWPWLGRPLTALRYVMYCWFYGRRHVLTHGTSGQNHARCNGEKLAVGLVERQDNYCIRTSSPRVVRGSISSTQTQPNPNHGSTQPMDNSEFTRLWYHAGVKSAIYECVVC